MERTKKEALTTVEAVREECDEAVQTANASKRHYDRLSDNLEAHITAEAGKRVQDTNEKLQKDYKAHLNTYNGLMLGGLGYSLLITVFTAIKSQAFVSDFTAFFGAIWGFAQGYLGFSLEASKFVSQVANNIPQEIVAFIVYWLLFLSFMGFFIGALLGAIGFVLVKIFGALHEADVFDIMTLAVFLVSLAVMVFFADWIKTWLAFNLLLTWLMFLAIVLFARWYKDGYDKARGYY